MSQEPAPPTREHRFSEDKLDHVWFIDGKEYAFAAPLDEPDLYCYDDEEGYRWVRWFEECLFHVEGELMGESLLLMGWAEALIREMFGWRNKRTGKRRYRFYFIFVPRKNMKTLLLAGISLGLLGIDEENKPQVYLGAATEKQAKLCYAMAKDQITMSEKLAEQGHDTVLHEMFEVEDSYLRINAQGDRGGYLEVLSGVPLGKTGLNVHGTTLDEYHEFRNTKLRGYLRTGIANRKNSLFGYITTAGDNKESPCYTEFEYAKKVRDHLIKNDNYLQFLRYADEDDDPSSPATWAKANPGYGMSVDETTLKALWKEGEEDPAKRKEFLQFHLNLWVEEASDYLPMSFWDNCQEKKDVVSMEALRGLPCFGGLDLADTNDMVSFALAFPTWNTVQMGESAVKKATYKILVWYWACQKSFDRSEKTTRPYRNWEADHNLERCGDNSVDFGIIRSRIVAICKQFKVQEIGYDPREAKLLASVLLNEDKLKMVRISPGFVEFNAPTKHFRDLAIEREIFHDGNAVLRWNIRNAKVIKNSLGYEMVTKTQSAGKVDGLIAVHLALRVGMDAEPPPPDPNEHYRRTKL